MERHTVATSKSAANRVRLTPERIRKAACPKDKQQHFIWDDDPRSLGLRITHAGAKAFIFEFRVHGRNGRITIGSADSWDIGQARAEARRLQVLVDADTDPRDHKAAAAAQNARERVEANR